MEGVLKFKKKKNCWEVSDNFDFGGGPLLWGVNFSIGGQIIFVGNENSYRSML